MQIKSDGTQLPPPVPVPAFPPVLPSRRRLIKKWTSSTALNRIAALLALMTFVATGVFFVLSYRISVIGLEVAERDLRISIFKDCRDIPEISNILKCRKYLAAGYEAVMRNEPSSTIRYSGMPDESCQEDGLGRCIRVVGDGEELRLKSAPVADSDNDLSTGAIKMQGDSTIMFDEVTYERDERKWFHSEL